MGEEVAATRLSAPRHQRLLRGLLLHIFAGDAQFGYGGLVDWTQQLLANTKERLMISGMGSNSCRSGAAPAEALPVAGTRAFPYIRPTSACPRGKIGTPPPQLLT
jgi:hypothetical protein